MRQKPWAKLAISLFLALSCAAPVFSQNGGPAGLADGAGVWANMWNYPQGDLDAYCLNLRDHGIHNVFIQTSRSTTPAIAEPEKLGALIDACHRHKMRVIAWSFSELNDPLADADKMIAAARFTSQSGQQIDGIAPNMEKNLEQWRIEKYSQRIRSQLGNNYPMMAVVYSPLNHCFEVARIPWKTLAQYYDCIAPMVYWNSKYQKIDAYTYTIDTVKRIRELTGRPDIEIHAIGDGMGTTSESFHQFMRACGETEATGISLYPNQKLTAAQMDTLGHHRDYMPANARFRLAAFRELVAAGYLNQPPGKDPSRPITRGDFYRLVVTQMYPALVPAKGSKSNWPTSVDCRQASPVEAFGILAGLKHVAEPGDSESIEQLMAQPIKSDEAFAILAHVVEHDRRDAGHHKHGHGRMDAWLAPAAKAEPLQSPAGNSRTVNYLDGAQMVIQAASGLKK